jgi:ABC-type transport system substrate-binding protein
MGDRFRRGAALLASVAIIVAACNTPEPQDSAEPGSSATTSSAGPSAPAAVVPTGDLIAAVETTGSQEFAPHLAGHDNLPMGKLMYDTLTRVNKDTQQLEGHLAESYSLSDDGLTWTFKLRPNIPFHDGWGTLTSEDVKYSWEQWIREDSVQNRATQLRQAVGGTMDNFEIVNDLEFKVHSGTEPFVTLPAVLSSTINCLLITSK